MKETLVDRAKRLGMYTATVGEMLDEIERLRTIEVAAKNLMAQKGRHNTQQAYLRLADTVTPNG